MITTTLLTHEIATINIKKLIPITREEIAKLSIVQHLSHFLSGEEVKAFPVPDIKQHIQVQPENTQVKNGGCVGGEDGMEFILSQQLTIMSLIEFQQY
jgi:hypothetical protein